ncbi:MAG: DUF885 domain-containing protein [Cytophagaceae bacterium]|nr:DUF885 domain-containing protein [Gemmatimonadaceae bacterium]
MRLTLPIAFVASLLSTVARPATSGPLPSARADTLAQQVTAVADDMLRVLNTADGRAGRFASNATPTQRAAWDANVDAWDTRLQAIDGTALVGRPEWVTWGVLREAMEANRGLRVCRVGPEEREACYRAQVRAWTTLPLTAEEVTSNAAAIRRSLDAELAPVVQRVLGTSDVDEARRRFRSEARFMAGSREDLTRLTNAALTAGRARMQEWFLDVAPDTLVIVPEPADREATAGAPARYQRAAGGNPAALVLNLYRPEQRPAMGAWVAAVHEGYPGHHHQISIGARARHPVLGFFLMAGFTEGWGLYSERLADEMGLYPSDLERAWYLAHLSDAAIGMLIDPAINTGRWSREQAIDTMVTVSGRPRWEAENYAARHLATSGQIVTYAVGYQEIMRLRADAKQRLGARFDIREFHRAVLEDGEVTLPMLREKVERWVGRTMGGESAAYGVRGIESSSVPSSSWYTRVTNQSTR